MRRTKTDAGERDREQSDEQRDGEATAGSDPVGAVHEAVGNQAVKELHERGAIQAKLAVSQPGDPAEREAERVARAVTREGATGAGGGAADGERETGDGAGGGDPEVEVDRRGGAVAGATTVGSETEARIRSVRSGGRRLPPGERSFFEERFGRDLSDVRVHTGPEADAAARSIDAAAFTLGSDVAFASGNYRPGTERGRRLLAHELTHVAQQDGESTRRVDRQGPVVRRPERGASVSEVKSYLACNMCNPGPGQRCTRELSDRALRVLLAAGWRPDVHVSVPMANAAETIVSIDERVAHDDAIQTYIKVEFLVENADVIQGHAGDKQLSYPGNRPEFNSFWEQLGDEVLKMAIGEMLPLSDAAGFALDVGLAIYSNYIADRDLREDAIRDTIITRLDDELDEDVRSLYNEGAREHRPLKERRDMARRFLWDLPGTTRGFDGPEASSRGP